MSQEKVDRYKEEKKTRKEDVAKKKKKEKIRVVLTITVLALIVAGLLAGIGITIYNNEKAKYAEHPYAADSYVLEDYADIQGLETEEAEEPEE